MPVFLIDVSIDLTWQNGQRLVLRIPHPVASAFIAWVDDQSASLVPIRIIAVAPTIFLLDDPGPTFVGSHSISNLWGSMTRSAAAWKAVPALLKTWVIGEWEKAGFYTVRDKLRDLMTGEQPVEDARNFAEETAELQRKERSALLQALANNFSETSVTERELVFLDGLMDPHAGKRA